MSLMKCKINLNLTWSEDCVIYSATEETKFAVTDTKRCVCVARLSIQDNINLLKQLESSFDKKN